MYCGVRQIDFYVFPTRLEVSVDNEIFVLVQWVYFLRVQNKIESNSCHKYADGANAFNVANM